MSLLFEDYWRDPQTGKDRRKEYPDDFDAEIFANGSVTVNRIQAVMSDYREATGNVNLSFTWASGWRPPAVNAAQRAAGARTAARSKHMTAQAGDVREPPDRPLSRWLMTDAGQDSIARRGLYMEHPSATAGKTGETPWVHLQTVPPRSGRRVFYP